MRRIFRHGTFGWKRVALGIIGDGARVFVKIALPVDLWRTRLVQVRIIQASTSIQRGSVYFQGVHRISVVHAHCSYEIWGFNGAKGVMTRRCVHLNKIARAMEDDLLPVSHTNVHVQHVESLYNVLERTRLVCVDTKDPLRSNHTLLHGILLDPERPFIPKHAHVLELWQCHHDLRHPCGFGWWNGRRVLQSADSRLSLAHGITRIHGFWTWKRTSAGCSKKMVTLEVSNGLSTTGPAWFPGDPSDLHWFKNKPANVYKIG